DDEIRLPRRWAKNFRAKASNIKSSGAHRHHLNGTAGEAERHGPDGILAYPVDDVVESEEVHSLGRGITVGEVFANALAVLGGDVGAVIRHADILTFSTQRPRRAQEFIFLFSF